jgi:acyl carrier protein
VAVVRLRNTTERPNPQTYDGRCPLIPSAEIVQKFIEDKFLFGKPLEGLDEPLFSSGAIDSFGVLELISFLEKKFDVLIDTQQHQLVEFDTVHSILDLVLRLKAAHAD